MNSSSRIIPEISRHHHQQQDEGKSVLSNSSGGSSTLMDSVSQKQRRQKIYATTAQAERQNLRKFTSAVSKPGQARETREAISRVLSAANPTRPPPLAEPIDYERFITEKSAQLENDKDRDLLLFFRDDISGSEIYAREKTAVPSVRHRDIDEADWLLTKDVLKFCISPYVVINFNYVKFAGEFKKFESPQNLNYLRFESDMIFDEEKSNFAEQLANEVLREGILMVYPSDSIVDSFKSEKKRHCILRRSEDGKVYMEIYKQASILQQHLFPPLEIKSAQIKASKKGKILQISAVPDKRTLMLSAENESDLQFWLFEIDRAITWKCKDIIASEDNFSLNSSTRDNSVPPSHDSESVASEESTGSGNRDSISIWRGKNAAAKALQPPIVERNNIFSLYWDMEPMPEPDGEKSVLMEGLNEVETSNAKKIQQISAHLPAQKAQQQKKSTSSSVMAISDDASISSREISPDPSAADFFGEKPAILFTAQIRQLDIKTRFACRETPEQIEPFFLRLFLFDASLGSRICEEFHVEVPTQRFTELRSSSAIIASKQIVPERIHGISRNRIQSAEKLICTIHNPRPSLYLVAFIERILSDIPGEIYTKSGGAIDAKTSVKIQKSISSAFLRLNHLRTLFAWTAIPIFPSLCSGRNFSPPNSNIRNSPIYKCEGKMTDMELQKLLNDIQKPEKIAKWTSFPNSSLTLEADVTSVLCQIPMRISPSYYPLRPWRVPSPESAPLSPSFQLQSFMDHNVEPFRGLTNLLYVYPISLNYSTQKTFARARNIACTIHFVQSKSRQMDHNFARSHPIYHRIHPNGPLVQSFNCAVQYHEQTPSFNEEVKIQLPSSLHQTDHLLFTFTHISLANALSTKNSSINEHYETQIGYSWLPLTRENSSDLPHLIMSENCQEFDLPVSTNLPQNYIDAKLVDGKEGATCSNAEIKFVEGGKHLFRVRLRLISSIFTTQEQIQNFFQLCQHTYHHSLDTTITTSVNDIKSVYSANMMIRQKIFHSANACSASEVVQNQEDLSPSHELSLNFEQELMGAIEQLTSVDIDRIIPFFEVILNRLFSLLTLSRTPELAITSLGAIVKLVDCLYTNRKPKRDILRNYIRLHFSASIIPQNEEDSETLHGAIFKYIPALFKHAESRAAEFQKIFRQLWFLLDCATKSMAHWLILNNLVKAPRAYRFPNELYFCLEEFFQSLGQQIIDKHNEFKVESRSANLAVAYLLNYCMSLMDRHQVMKELYGIVKRMDAVDSRTFRIYKFELLRTLCWHEHWIPICLPLLTDKYGTVMRGDTIIFEGFPHNQNQTKNAGGGFFSKLFSHIFSPPYAPHESNEIERYSSTYSEHFYLSETYCSVHFMAGLLFQEMTNSLRDSREYRRKIIRLVRNMLVKHYKDQRYGDTSAKNRIAILYLPLLRFIIENIRELEATFKGKTDSPMQSPIMSAKMKATNEKYSSSLTGQISDNMKTKLSAHSNDMSTSSLCKSALTTSSYNSQSTAKGSSGATAKEKASPLVVVLAEKLDKSEGRDLLISSLYILNNLPKKILAAFWNVQDTIQTPRSKMNVPKKPEDDSSTNQQQAQNLLLDFIRFLELSLLAFRYKGRSYHIMQQTKRSKSKGAVNFETTFDSYKSFGTGGQFSTLTEFNDSTLGGGGGAEEDSKDGQNGYFMDCHLSQEVALIVLETIQTIGNQVAIKTKYSSSKYYDTIFMRLLNLELELLHENWSETVRLQTLAALAVFVNLFSSRFFHSGPLDCLSTLVKALLLQLNSRIPRIQSSAAALIQLLLRGGFDASTSFSTKLPSAEFGSSAAEKNQSNNYSTFVSEKLGRAGAQISVALARLLSEKHLDNYRFERGLSKIESLVAGGDKHGTSSSLIVTSLFERAVLELVKQLRGVLEATRAITDMSNNPIQLADLHIRLADSYRGSAALRSEFFDALANIHICEGWYSEGAICQAHSLAIIGKELQAKNVLNADWSLLNILNETIALEEGMKEANLGNIQQGGFTLEDFTRKVENLVRTLILSERYEAVGPIYRLSIPIFEDQLDFKAMVEIYAEMQQACSRAAEIKINGKRHLGSYFKVTFYSQNHFYDEHKSEWIYREPRLTSLAEACDRMVESVRLALGHDQVQILSERMDGGGQAKQLDPNIAFIQMAYVEPCHSEDVLLHKLKNNTEGGNEKLLEKINDPMNYLMHTNVRTFIQEEKMMDSKVAENEPEMAKTALRRLILTVQSPFPNTRRRQRIVRTEEIILSPLELACESLLFKASQIRRILAAADIPKSHFGVYDKETLKRLDMKQLQLFLQGSVSPTVNAGLLAYAEAFTTTAQKQRYGKNGIGRLIGAFKTLIGELDDALRVNEAALAGERQEYQGMLRQSFDGMLERLSMFFEGEKFLQKDGTEEETNDGGDVLLSLGVFGNISRMGNSAEMHIFDSISGLNDG